MLGENIQRLRKQKALTQEELAAHLHVVRQTVSKWEKNLSVPDAAALQRLAEVLDTPVSLLLGADIETDASGSDLALQLARINEQLAIKNRRAARIWKAVVILLAASVLLPFLFAVFSIVRYAAISQGGAGSVNSFAQNAH